MITHLIRCTTFVKIVVYDYLYSSYIETHADALRCIDRYTDFLLRDLTIDMFVPINKKGNLILKTNIEKNENKNILFGEFIVSELLNGYFITLVIENHILLYNITDKTFFLNGIRISKIEDLVDINVKLTEIALQELNFKTFISS